MFQPFSGSKWVLCSSVSRSLWIHEEIHTSIKIHSGLVRFMNHSECLEDLRSQHLVLAKIPLWYEYQELTVLELCSRHRSYRIYWSPCRWLAPQSRNQGSERDSVNGSNKGQAMIDARPIFKTRLDFVKTIFKDTVQDVDGVIHVASVSRSFAPRALRDGWWTKMSLAIHYDTGDNENELIIPAINRVRSILEATTTQSQRSRNYFLIWVCGRHQP